MVMRWALSSLKVALAFQINYNLYSSMKIRSVSAIPLLATFADAFGGEGNVPAHLLTPASHFRRIRRVGQMATIVAWRGARPA